MIKLFYAPDNASLIIRIILHELDISYQSVLVDRSKKEQASEAYVSLHPKGLIPVCIIDGAAVFETAAIALTLAESASRLGARNSIKLATDISDACRPQFLKWLFFVSNTLHPDLRQMFYADKYAGADKRHRESFLLLVRERLCDTFGIIDKQYGDSGEDFLLAKTPSIIDIYLALCMRWVQIYPVSERGKITSADYPSISRMLEKLQERDAVVDACGKEGITGRFFTQPQYSNPSEGSAL